MENFKISAIELAAKIDHTLLKPEASIADVEQTCAAAIKYGFASVCVNPCYIKHVAQLLQDQLPKVCGVVGFPLGASHSHIKQAEANQNIQDGAHELDMVINIAAALASDYEYVTQDINGVLQVCHQGQPSVILKVILEMSVLPPKTKLQLCELANDLGVDFIKTSTGLHPTGGATIDDVKFMHVHRGSCKVKASGGIRDGKTAHAMLMAGADRIGTSSGPTIIDELIQHPRTTPKI